MEDTSTITIDDPATISANDAITITTNEVATMNEAIFTSESITSTAIAIDEPITAPSTIATEEIITITATAPSTMVTEEPITITGTAFSTIATEELITITGTAPSTMDTDESSSITTAAPSTATEEHITITGTVPSTIVTEELTTITATAPSTIDTEKPTNITTTSPARAITTTSSPSFAWCPHPTKVWVLRRVVKADEAAGTLTMMDEDGEEETLRRDEIHPYDETHSQDLSDVARVNNFHEAPLLSMLTMRYDIDKIYTFAANVLISINPYKTIPSLYDLRDGRIKYDEENPSPHVYTIAEFAFSSMMAPKRFSTQSVDEQNTIRDQSIIVSGESGAGKTEASKHVMRYLISASRKLVHDNDCMSARLEQATDDELGHYIQDVLLQSNPVLEAFGNAKTVRNDNSSRFGKYSCLLYDSKFRIIGGVTEHFLLEKSRLVQVSHGERNYHIFYQACKGLPQDVKSALRLGDPEAFRMLNGGNCTSISDDDDEAGEFRTTVQALRVLGVSDSELDYLWKLLAFLLQLGNISFTEIENGPVQMNLAGISTEELAQMCALPSSTFGDTLTVRHVQSGRGETFVRPLTAEESQNNCFGLIKWLYGCLFGWIVRKVNQAHAQRAESASVQSFIGILDIFGFEIMRVNSFEQLCINFANEVLQQQFNHHIFVLEKEEYKREGLDWTSISFKDNQHVIDLIARKPSGIFPILEEHGMLNRKPDNKALLTTYHNAFFDKNDAYSKPRFAGNEFIIRHFAGEVTYHVESFLEKNNDSLQEHLLRFVLSSTSPFLQNVMGATPVVDQPGYIPGIPTKLDKDLDEDDGDDIVSTTVRSRPAKRNQSVANSSAQRITQFAATVTVSFQFRMQLQELITKLRQTIPHYIKCIKPNNVKAAGACSRQLIMQQLRYSGVLEVVRIRREGYPTREDFGDFYKSFKILAWGKGWSDPELCTDAETRRYAASLAAEFLPQEVFQIGTHKMFFKANGLDLMRLAVRMFLDRRATTIQAKARCWVTRKQYLRLLLIIEKLQSLIRMFCCKVLYRKQTTAVASLQAFLDGRYKRNKFLRTKASTVIVQKYVRRFQAQKRCRILRFRRDTAIQLQTRLAVICQSCLRGNKVRQMMKRRTQAAILIQSLVRVLLAKTRSKRERSARTIQTIQRGRSNRKKFIVDRKHKLGAIVKIQSFMRCRLVILWHRRIVRHLVLLQAWCRAINARRVCMTLQTQLRLKREREGRKATLIQSYARMWPKKYSFHTIKRAAVKIQSLGRMIKARYYFVKRLKDVLRLQAQARRLICMKRYKTAVKNVTTIQSLYRKWTHRSKFIQFRKCIRVLQAIQRRKIYQARYFRARKGFIRAQATARRNPVKLRYTKAIACATRIESVVRRFICKRRFQKSYRAVLRLQAAVHRFTRNLQLYNRILTLHANARAANLREVDGHLFAYPLDWLVRNKWDRYKTLLHSAIESGDLVIVKHLAPEPADLFKDDIDGNSAIHYAAGIAHLDLLKYFSDLAHPSRFKMRPPRTANNRRLDRSETTLERGALDDDEDAIQGELQQFRGMSFILGPFARRNLSEIEDANSDEEDQNDDNQSVQQGFDRASATVIKEGFLKKKKEESSGWQRRWVVVTEHQLLYYRWKRDKRPKKVVPLVGAMIKKSASLEATFEFYHPSLLGRSNKQGCLQFKADNEADLQQWMTPLRAITGVSAGGFQQTTRHLDLGFRRDWLRMTNKAGSTPLHTLVQFHEKSEQMKRLPAPRLVMAASWIVEMGGLVNAQDLLGNTPLHLVNLRETGNEFTQFLILKEANVGLRNLAGLSPMDLASADVLQNMAVGRRGLADRNVLLPPPRKLQGYSYMSLYVEKNSMPSTDALENPFLTISVYNGRRNLVEPQQDMALPIMRKARYLWWGATWHMQTPLENLDEAGCVVVFEFKDQRFSKSGKHATSEIVEIAWVRLSVDLKRIESKNVNLEMQTYPLDISRSQSSTPADCFLEGDVALSRKLFDVDAKALTRSLEEKDEIIAALDEEYMWVNTGEDRVSKLRRPLSRSYSKRSSEAKSPSHHRQSRTPKAKSPRSTAK